MPANLIGVQIGPISFIDEGTEQVLDTLQEKAAVNALMLGVLTWAGSVAGRADAGVADHGKPGPQPFVGGGFWEPNPRYYAGTPLREFRAPDALYEGFDAMREVVPAAKKRGMKVYPYLFDTGPKDRPFNVPGIADILEVDIHGRKSTRPCLHHPGYQAWMFAIVEDLCRSHDVDGISWGMERQGPLMNMMHGESPACFCSYCRQEAHRRGMNPERAREGYQKIFEFFAQARAGQQPRDGYFVTFLRQILNYPEVLMWEKQFLDSHNAFCQALYGWLKFLDPKLELGLGVWQRITTFNPYLRAQYDYEKLRDVCDWVKPVVYNIPAGTRFGGWFAELLQSAILRDTSLEDVVGGLYSILHYDEAPLAELPAKGFSPEYVRQETARMAAALDGKAKIIPGIGVGVPPDRGGKTVEPSDVKAAIEAAFAGGADGVLLSRMYTEMRTENLAAAGATLRALGKA